MNDCMMIKNFVNNYYGNLISSESPVYDEKIKKWVAFIKTDYPVLTQDDREKSKKMLRFIPIKKIGTVYFNNNLTFLENESISRDECEGIIEKQLNKWEERAEKIIIQASADYLVKISEFRHFFTPVEEIIDSLLEYDAIYDKDVIKHRSLDRQDKATRYFGMLQGMGFVRRSDEGYENGELFVTLKKRLEERGEYTDEHFKEAIFSELIRSRYSTLREAFKIHRLQPTIHVDNCVYRPSLDAEELVHLKQETILNNYKRTYGNINPMTLTHILRKLKDVNIIRRYDSEYWTGNEELLSQMLESKKKFELAPVV